MTPIAPRQPRRPLVWPNAVLDLQRIVPVSHGPVYIVGGAVRDAYLHRPLHDLDLATPRDAIQLGRLIADCLNGAFYILDFDRDIARVLINSVDVEGQQLVIDIARFRGDDLFADLIDRDFTFNAMAVDLHGDLAEIIDPLNGEDDLVNRIVRQCEHHAISDDPIRALRAVRQSVQFEARIEPDTLTSMRRAVATIVDVSPERLRDEFFKLLMVSRPAVAIRVAEQLGLLHSLIPEIEPLHRLAQPTLPSVNGWEHTLRVIDKLNGLIATFNASRSDDTTASFIYGSAAAALGHLRPRLEQHISRTWPNERSHVGLLILSALFYKVGAASVLIDDTDNAELAGESLARRRAIALRVSNDEKERLAKIVRYYQHPLTMEIDDLEMHLFWRRLGDAGVDVCLVALADYQARMGSEIDHDGWMSCVERVRDLLDAYFNRHEQIVSPPSLVDGTTLMDTFSLSPGKHIGRLLDIIREGQVTGEITTVDEALDTAQSHISDSWLDSQSTS